VISFLRVFSPHSCMYFFSSPCLLHTPPISPSSKQKWYYTCIIMCVWKYMKISLKTTVVLYTDTASVPPFVTRSHKMKPAACLRLVLSFIIHRPYIPACTHIDDDDSFEVVDVGDHCIRLWQWDGILVWTLAVNCSE
jgi:hypothetical protein